MLSRLSDFVCGTTLIFREKFLDLRPKSVCAVEMTMYVHLTCKNVNKKMFMLQ